MALPNCPKLHIYMYITWAKTISSIFVITSRVSRRAGKAGVVETMVLCHTMVCFYVISYTQISIGYYPCAHYVYVP